MSVSTKWCRSLPDHCKTRKDFTRSHHRKRCLISVTINLSERICRLARNLGPTSSWFGGEIKASEVHQAYYIDTAAFLLYSQQLWKLPEPLSHCTEAAAWCCAMEVSTAPRHRAGWGQPWAAPLAKYRKRSDFTGVSEMAGNKRGEDKTCLGKQTCSGCNWNSHGFYH